MLQRADADDDDDNDDDNNNDWGAGGGAKALQAVPCIGKPHPHPPVAVSPRVLPG